ncbi:hypothetical protein MKJ04_15685 [Pontibacter sp. E15-1]|uniref:hypothetical protein n=1 Tax=Pontibacter sp. E15-1 TaxID=2919918 RepID=UPI001F503608|nr:hypothetical protein [Pontibacter sp. E15-1]MCJ8166289.1 hypothetical protein [Pontibacter sp. E15-1]
MKFKRYEHLDGPVYSLPKSEILLIEYENKTTETFELESAAPAGMYALAETPKREGVDVVDGYNKGQQDAALYYKGYKGAGTGTLVVSLLSPLVGLVPAIACSSTPPKEHNLDYPSSELMKNQDYKNGYSKGSRRIKSRKVWRNWGAALGVNVILVALLSNQ